jgi:hypothetical protein
MTQLFNRNGQIAFYTICIVGAALVGIGLPLIVTNPSLCGLLVFAGIGVTVALAFAAAMHVTHRAA